MKCKIGVTLLAGLQCVSFGYAQLDQEYQTAESFSSGSCVSLPCSNLSITLWGHVS